MTELSPEDRLRNVADAVMRHTEVIRTHNGRGRGRTYAGDRHATRDASRQLAEMVLEHLEGKLEPVEDHGHWF